MYKLAKRQATIERLEQQQQHHASDTTTATTAAVVAAAAKQSIYHVHELRYEYVYRVMIC